MLEIIKNKVRRFRQSYPDVSEESIKKMILREVKNNCFGNFAAIRKNIGALKVDDKLIESILDQETNRLGSPKYRKQFTITKGIKSKKQNSSLITTSKEEFQNVPKNSENYRHTFEFLRNLRLRYFGIIEKLSKYRKQLQQRQVDLSQFNLKTQKFDALIMAEIKAELRDFAFGDAMGLGGDGIYSNSTSGISSSSIKSHSMENQRGKEIDTFWEKINQRNRIVKNRIPQVDPRTKKHIPTSFSRVYSEYRKFSERRQEKIKKLQKLEKQIESLKEKRLIFIGEAKKCYLSIIRSPNEYNRSGILKVIEELSFFEFKVAGLSLPPICETVERKFIIKYETWKLESMRIERDDEQSAYKDDNAGPLNYNSSVQSARRYLMKYMKGKNYLKAMGGSKSKFHKNRDLLSHLIDDNYDSRYLSKLDKLYVLGESMLILKEREIRRLIERYSSHMKTSNMTERMLNLYFGIEETNNIRRTYKIIF